MFNPLTYPYVRAKNYTDGSLPKVLSDEFYNPTQDAIATLFGAATGSSFSIAVDDFERESGGPVTSGAFGTQLRIGTLLNTQAFSITAPFVGDHGVWRVSVVSNGPMDFIAQDNSCFLGTRQFTWNTKVRIGTRIHLDTVAQEGFVIGLKAPFTGYPAFLAGKDKPNWQAFLSGTLFDTGVPVTDGAWVWLTITRQTDGNVRWYIQTSAAPPALVVTKPFPGSLDACRRYFRMHDSTGGALAGDFTEIDRYARGIER